jgi:hypothetical protein
MILNDREGMGPCDRSSAVRFLQSLGGRAFTFQAFDDNAARKNRALARILHGTIDQHFAQLEDLNRKGAGIFVTINRTDGKGRGHHNIIGVRAVFVDLDGSPLAPVMSWALSPHIVVESSLGRFHAYWLLDGTVTPTDFGGLQKRLAKLFDGDPVVHDLPRVLRLPGFLHRKRRPFRTRIVHLNRTLPHYSVSELSTALAHIGVNDVARKCRSETPAIEPDQPRNIKAAIRYLKADASPAVAFSHGNDSTYQTACVVRSCFGLLEATCYDLMVEHFNSRCDPPWSLEELETLVANAYRYGQGAPGDESAEAEFAKDPIEPIFEIGAVRTAQAPKRKRKMIRARAALRRRRAMAFARE